MEVAEIEGAVLRLEELVERVDGGKEHKKKDLLMRSRNLTAALLDPYVLFHTKIVVDLVRKREGDKIDEIAAWLHDIGRAVVDDGHREVGAIWAAKWLKQFYITDEEFARILDGIKNHGTKSKPVMKTGKLLKLVDALAVFDEGWVAMIKKYADVHGKPEMLEQFRKKAAVIREMGTEEDVKVVERVAKRYGIEI